jgi:hypothetical protein
MKVGQENLAVTNIPASEVRNSICSGEEFTDWEFIMVNY